MIRGREAGASLVSVMIAVAVMALGAVGAATAMRHLLFARRNAAASNATAEIGATVASGLMATLQAWVTAPPPCKGATMPSTIQLGANVGTLTESPPGKKSLIALPPPIGSLNYPPEAAAAVNRCTSTARKRGAGAIPNAYLYDCYVFTPPGNYGGTVNKTAGRESFVGSKFAFVEVYAQLKDFQLDKPISCATAALGRGGISLYYAMHWVTQTSEGYLFKTRIGEFDASF